MTVGETTAAGPKAPQDVRKHTDTGDGTQTSSFRKEGGGVPSRGDNVCGENQNAQPSRPQHCAAKTACRTAVSVWLVRSNNRLPWTVLDMQKGQKGLSSVVQQEDLGWTFPKNLH